MLQYPIVENNRRWSLYVHINKINGKKYVGITNKKPTSRWGTNGKGYKTTKHFYSAIQKYGWNNFQHIILEQNLTKNEASNLEIILISVWHTQDQKHGYNFQIGGYSGNLGMRMSEESRDKRRGANSHRSRKVVCLNTGKVYSSQTEAAIDNRINWSSDLSYAADGKRQFAGRDKAGNPLIWVRYDDYIHMNEDEINRKLSKFIKKTNETQIICLNTMRVFNGVSAASSYCGSAISGIIRCAQSWVGKQTGHVRKHSGKDPQTGELLSWIYKDDYDYLSDDRKDEIFNTLQIRRTSYEYYY